MGSVNPFTLLMWCHEEQRQCSQELVVIRRDEMTRWCSGEEADTTSHDSEYER